MEDYELFWKRIKKNDRVLVKAPIQNKTKECYFLGTVINKRGGGDSPIVAIKLEGEEGIRGIKLKDIGSIEQVKKTIIPMDFIFKDENIKAKKLGIRGEYDCGADKNCDGVLSPEESGMGEDDLDDVTDQMNQPNVPIEAETTIGGTKGNEAQKFSHDENPYDSDDSDDFEDAQEDTQEDEQVEPVKSNKVGGKKKKKKNRSRSKKNKKKRKRKNSTKKKN